MKLSRKLLIFVGTMVLLTSGLVTAIFYVNLVDDEKKRISTQLNYINNLKKEVLSERFNHLLSTTLALEKYPPIYAIGRALESPNKIDPETNESLEIWKDRLATIFKGVLDVNDQYLDVRYISSRLDGKEILRVERRGSKIIVEENPHSDQIEEYYQRGISLKKAEVYISPVELSRESGKIVELWTPVVKSVVPVMDGERLYGVLVINKDMRGLLHKVARDFTEDSTTYLYDHQGYIIAHVDPDRTFGIDLGKKAKLDLNQEGVIQSSVNYQYNPQSTADQITVLSRMPEKNAYVYPRQLLKQVLLLIFLLLIIILLVTLWGSNRMATSIIHLNRMMNIFVERGAGAEVDKNKMDSFEVQQLAETFNYLCRKVVAQRNELLESQKLIAQQEKFSALGVLSSGIAHEINNPLAILKSHADSLGLMLERDMASKDKLMSLNEKLTEGILRIRDIVEGLRTFSRSEVSKKHEPFVLQEAIESGLKFVRAKLPQNSIDLTVTHSDDKILIFGRAGQISQVIVNLVNNAIDEIQTSERPWIRIVTENMNETVFVRVIDSGTISEEHKAKVMEPFFTTKKEGYGTGLGLSISKNIVERHGGELYLDPASENTCFVIRLPIYRPEPRETANS